MDSERISHYQLVRRIGRGGMGEVWEATDLKLRRPVALKFLSGELMSDPSALQRFEREALAAAELSHPHIATVYAFEPDAERPFIAMELLSGPSLRERLEAGALPVAEALAIARDVAEALAYAHRRGTRHRDIKPENLMFDEHGSIRVMDFGLARATLGSRLTVDGTQLGTPAYMAPESISGEPVAASDVFALGLVSWEMLAGRRAFPGDNAMATMFQIANQSAPPLLEVRPEVPAAAVALIDRMLDKDPATRISAAEVAGALESMTTHRTPTAPMAAAPQVSRAGRARVVLGGLMALVLVALVGIVFITSRTSRRQAEANRLFELAIQANEAGQPAESRRLLVQAVAKDPANASVLNALGLIAVQEGRYASADSLFHAMLRHHPRDAAARVGAYFNLADSYSRRGMYGEAVASHRQSFAIDSSSAESYNNLGWALIQNRQVGDALALLERGIARFPGEAFLYKNAGLARLQLGDAGGALERLDRAVALDSTLTEAVELRERARRETSTPTPPPVPASPP
jgi:Tfp pilus assembly protein PilF